MQHPLAGVKFRRGIARKIVLGYVLPLIVLLVAGILIPLFLWSFVGRYRYELDVRLELTVQAGALRHAVTDAGTTYEELQIQPTPERRRALQRAREEFADRRLALASLLDDHPIPTIALALDRAEKAYREWQRGPKKTLPGFTPVKWRFDEFMVEVERERDLWNTRFQRVELLRRIATIVFPLTALVLALVIGQAIAQSITQPLADLVAAAEEIQRGEIAHAELPAEGDTDDEIGDLRRAFREMILTVRHREAALHERNDDLAAIGQRISSVLDATNDGIVLLDRAGTFAIVNPRFAFFLGMRQDDLLGKSFARVGPRLLALFRHQDHVRQTLLDLLRDPDATMDVTFELLRPVPRVLRCFSAPVPRATVAERLGRIIVLRDVTRETQVDRMKTDFVSTVSHELRTPLTAIRGYIDLIVGGRTGPLTETQSEFLSLAQVNVQRLTLLINDMLDISRIESEGIQIRREPVTYLPVVEQAVRMMEEQASARDLTLSFKPPTVLPKVLGDADRLTQVLMNLLSNAIKYTPPGGKVTVDVVADTIQVTTRIIDTGIGIPPEDRSRLFTKFFRADNSTTRETGGTGLGLAISKAILDRMGGTIWVESTPQLGSTFAFTVPLAPEAPPVAVNESPTPTRRLVLVVQDQAAMIHRLNHALTVQGMLISAATTAAEAERRTKGLRPDAVLLEPFATSFDALALLRTLRAEVTTRMPVLLYRLRVLGNVLELDDSLALVPPTVLAITEALERVLPDEPERSRPLLVLGGPELGELVREARGRVDYSPHWIGLDVEELREHLGALRPLLLVVDTERVDGRAVGALVRGWADRFPGERIPVVLVGAFGTRTQLLLPPGTGPTSLDRIAQTAQEAMSAVV